MRVGMDISQLAHNGGVATYTENITRELSDLKKLEMTYFYSSLRKSYRGKLKRVKKFRLPPTFFEMLFNKWRNVSIEKFIGAIDIFHSSDWIQPPSKAKKVTTFHDVIPIKYPKWSHPKIIEVQKRRLEIVNREIDLVIAVSESTKKDLLEVSNLDSEKVVVIYEGPTATFKPQSVEKIKAFKMKYKLPETFILATGGVGERKNLNRIKEATKDCNLVITGQTIPWLDIEELELLYSSAQALVYCSLYEGFGLPILDAFSVGCPVITSNTSSMPEVGGGAVLYADPLDVGEIKKRLKEILEDRDLRNEIIKKGFEQVKKFSWEKAATETFEVYSKLLR